MGRNKERGGTTRDFQVAPPLWGLCGLPVGPGKELGVVGVLIVEGVGGDPGDHDSDDRKACEDDRCGDDVCLVRGSFSFGVVNVGISRMASEPSKWA